MQGDVKSFLCQCLAMLYMAASFIVYCVPAMGSCYPSSDGKMLIVNAD